MLFNQLGWGNSVFKIEGEGGGLSYLKRTTDSEFPRTFDVIPYRTLCLHFKMCGDYIYMKG